jgi:hypothetical protein
MKTNRINNPVTARAINKAPFIANLNIFHRIKNIATALSIVKIGPKNPNILVVY